MWSLIVMVVVMSVIVVVWGGVSVGTERAVAGGSRGTRVLRWRLVRQLGEGSLELGTDAYVLVETRDLNIQLRPLFFFFFLFLAFTAVDDHGGVGEGLLVLVGYWPSL